MQNLELSHEGLEVMIIWGFGFWGKSVRESVARAWFCEDY